MNNRTTPLADRVLKRIRDIAGPESVLHGEAATEFGHDGSFMEHPPAAVVRPRTTEQVAQIVTFCGTAGIPITPRGSGTGLAGGAVPVAGGLVMSLEAMTDLAIQPADATATAQAGVVTKRIQEAAASHGLMYPPDPASVEICTIGGNIACNSGGMSCLKYGVTADYVLGMTVVLSNGTVLRLGGKTRKRASGYRLMSLFVGSEGTLGIVTDVTLKLIPLPRCRRTAMVGFASVEAAAAAVSRVLGSGHFPAALEFVERTALKMVAEHLPAGFDPDLEAVLIIEQDGSDLDQVTRALLEVTEELGGVDNRIAQTETERERIWKARRQFGHVLLGMRHNFFSEDISVPISAIPEMVRRIRATGERFGIVIATIGHAGDGNLHPTLLFTDDNRNSVGAAAAEIFRAAIDLGGSISAEHGLGAIKRDHSVLEHGADAITLMRWIKDLLDPTGLLNPHKVLPENEADDGFLNRLSGWGTKLASGRDRAELGA